LQTKFAKTKPMPALPKGDSFHDKLFLFLKRAPNALEEFFALSTVNLSYL
jgi:hypothetical protein